MTRSDRKAVTVELSEWANRRHGVEVFVEPKTAVTETSVNTGSALGNWPPA